MHKYRTDAPGRREKNEEVTWNTRKSEAEKNVGQDRGQSEREKRQKVFRGHKGKPFHLPSKLLSHEASLTFTGSLSPGAPQGAGVTLHLWSERGPSVCRYKLEGVSAAKVCVSESGCVSVIKAVYESFMGRKVPNRFEIFRQT